MEFIKVIEIDNNEFGYYVLKEGSYKVMVFNNELRKQQVLTYADSVEESKEVIEIYIKTGFNFFGWELEGIKDFNL